MLMKAGSDKTAVLFPSTETIAENIAGDEAETESNRSSEETESPRSVGRWGAAALAKERVHGQVLRIREEETCLLGEDRAGKYYCDNDERRYLHRHRLNLVLVSRPILPCSRLSGKVTTTFKALQ